MKLGRTMLRDRPLTRFCVQVLLLYALLMAPWPGIAAGYELLYRGAAAILFGDFGSRGEAHFRAREHEAGGHDTSVTLVKRHDDRFIRKTITIGARYHGYAPTAVFLALAISTPIAWPRRWRLMLWGFLLVQIYVVMRLFLTLLEVFTDGELALWTPAPFWRAVVVRLTDLLAGSLVAGFVIPVFIWIGCLMWRGDWRSMRELLAPRS